MQRFWKPGIFLLAVLFSLPVFTTLSFILRPSNEVWQHLTDTVLSEYLINSALLMLGVGRGYSGHWRWLRVVNQCMCISGEEIFCLGIAVTAGVSGLHNCLHLYRDVRLCGSRYKPGSGK